MDHVVYVDHKARELEKLLAGSKSMVIRGAAGRKMPYGRVHKGDTLYFIQNNSEGLIRAKAEVTEVFTSAKMDKEESANLVTQHLPQLELTKSQIKKWAGKRYLVLITIGPVTELKSFAIDRSDYGNMDDWLLVEDVQKVKIKYK